METDPSKNPDCVEYYAVSKAWEASLKERWPLLYRKVTLGFGLAHPTPPPGVPGWAKIIEGLSAEIEFIAERYNLNDEQYPQVLQVKEKFGKLCFYWQIAAGAPGSARDEIRQTVNDAELASKSICDSCGKPGSACSTKTGWMRTLCEACMNLIGASKNS